MSWNIEEAKNWMIKYAKSLENNGDNKTSTLLLYDLFYRGSCTNEDLFKESLKNNTELDDIYIQWAIKEIHHDG